VKTCDYHQGDLVKYLPSGEQYTVHEVFPGDQYRPAHIGLGKTLASSPKRVHVVDVYTDPENVKLIARAGERTMFPGDDWSDELFEEK
jgi:hypothetical protein